jgi:hypothetical protein
MQEGVESLNCNAIPHLPKRLVAEASDTISAIFVPHLPAKADRHFVSRE